MNPAVRVALDRFIEQTRKVGLDMRLSSESSFRMGIRACVESALQVLDELSRSTP